MKISNFERSLDYEKYLTDGVILEVGTTDTNATLTFYQKFPSIENGKISKTKKDKRLLFEVSLPPEALVRLSLASLGRMKAKKNALKMKGNKTDNYTERAYFEYDEALGTAYDTDEINLSREDYHKITEALTNLAVTINPPPNDKK